MNTDPMSECDRRSVFFYVKIPLFFDSYIYKYINMKKNFFKKL